MQVLVKEELVRWSLVEVPEVTADMDSSEIESLSRQPIFESVNADGWDGEEVMEVSFTLQPDTEANEEKATDFKVRDLSEDYDGPTFDVAWQKGGQKWHSDDLWDSHDEAQAFADRLAGGELDPNEHGCNALTGK